MHIYIYIYNVFQLIKKIRCPTRKLRPKIWGGPILSTVRYALLLLLLLLCSGARADDDALGHGRGQQIVVRVDRRVFFFFSQVISSIFPTIIFNIAHALARQPNT